VSDVEVTSPRQVPLGGQRAMTVRRTLPTRERSLIGAWCFLDHYGPDDVAETGGMSVAPHPHTGLQTVSWLFTGEIEHRDSAGNHAMVRPGELNLMTAGHGISHSEVSTAGTTTLHGAQLWLALPEAARDGAPGFEHYAPPAVAGDGWTARVFLGSLLGETSPVTTHSPLLGAELLLEAGAALELEVDPTYEHGVLVDSGVAGVQGQEVKPSELAYVGPGSASLRIEAGDDGARVLLLGGTPFGEPIIMWWNFVGRSHEEVVASREAWQAQVLDDRGATRDPVAAGGLLEDSEAQRVVIDGQQVRAGRFGVVVGEHLAPIPAPPLPNVRLKQRR
jgi:redox-sensitive bicupin YhaK (pirin superfamily)